VLKRISIFYPDYPKYHTNDRRKCQIIGAENESNVIVKWIAKGTGVLRLAYSSDINCESIKELHVTIGDDFIK